MTQVEVGSAAEAARIIANAMTNQQVARTDLNAVSNRSHAVFKIRVVQAPLKNKVLISYLYIKNKH